MIKHIGAGVLALSLLLSIGFITPAPAQAASLTSAQIQAIIGLLQSFGADQSVINNISADLGDSSSSLSCSSFTDLTYGNFDNNPGGRVSQLQTWLGIPSNTFGFGTYGRKTQAIWNSKCSGTQTTPSTTPTVQNTNTSNNAGHFESPTSGPMPLQVKFIMNNGFTANPVIDWGDGATGAALTFDIAVSRNEDELGHTYTTAGTYTAKFEDASGNALVTQTITVTGGNSAQLSATIDQSSLTTSSLSPTITGTASGVSSVYIEITSLSSPDPTGTVEEGPTPVTVTNSRWSTGTLYGKGGFVAGKYTVSVQNGMNGPLLAQGTLTVGATTNQGSLMLTSPTANATYHVGDQIPMAWNYSNIPPNSQTILALSLLQASGNTSGTSGGSWQSTVITGSGQGNYLWQTGNNGYLNIPGTYQLSATVRQCDKLGCQYNYPSDSSLPTYATASPVQFTVAPSLAPTCSVTASAKSVLSNQPFTLTWSSTNATYMTGIKTQSSWSPNGSQAMTAGSPGTQTYTLTFFGPNGQTSCSTTVVASDTVTITSGFASAPNSGFTIGGASTIQGSLYVVLISSTYSGPTDWNTTQQLLTNGQTTYTTKSASVAVSNGQWAVPFGALPEGSYTVYVYDTSGNLQTTGTFQSTYKG